MDMGVLRTRRGERTQRRGLEDARRAVRRGWGSTRSRGGPRRDTLRLRTCDCGSGVATATTSTGSSTHGAVAAAARAAVSPAAQGGRGQLGPAARGELEQQPERALATGQPPAARGGGEQVGERHRRVGGDVVERVQHRRGDAQSAAVVTHARGVGDVEVGPGAGAGAGRDGGVRATCAYDGVAAVSGRHRQRHVYDGLAGHQQHHDAPRRTRDAQQRRARERAAERRGTTSTPARAAGRRPARARRLRRASATTDSTAARPHSSAPVATGGVIGQGAVVRGRSGLGLCGLVARVEDALARRCRRPCAGAWSG